MGFFKPIFLLLSRRVGVPAGGQEPGSRSECREKGLEALGTRDGAEGLRVTVRMG